MHYSISDFIQIVHQLRDPLKGCPWDIKQTNKTIIPYLLEESYEVVDAIEKDQFLDLKEELGDLLFQIIFLSQLAKENNQFDFNDVVNGISTKIVRRHPHVFGDIKVDTEEEVLKNWNAIKQIERNEKGDNSILDNVPDAFPALMRAEKLQKCCAKVGFDWDNYEGVINKVEEELLEVKQELCLSVRSQSKIEEEIGDLLFTVVNLSRHLNCNAEDALRKANKKFEKRFRKVESKLIEKGTTCSNSSFKDMDFLWNEVKEEEIKSE